MEETFYHILAKEKISEKDKKKLKKMYERLLREKELLKKVFSSVSLENKRILDIGTGQGFACKFLVDHAKDSEIVTVDKDPFSLNSVRNIIGDKIDKINFVKADLSNMSFLKDNYFDIVLSHYTLSTVDKNIFQKVLNEIYRVMVAGGLFIVIEGFGNGIMDYARKLTLELEEIYRQIMESEEEMNLDELLKIFREFKGFEIVRVRKLNDGLIDPTIEDFGRYLLSLVNSDKVRKRIIKILEEGKVHSFREAPDYAIYLRKRLRI